MYAQKELVLQQSASYGNYRLFGAATNIKIYQTGIEYDFSPFGTFLKSKINYSTEFEPVILLNEPTGIDKYGITYGISRQTLYGLGIAPVGLRMIWRNNKIIKPYVIAKGVIIGFDKKAISRDASYLNFSAQFGGGLQISLNDKIDLRLGLFNDTHVSNAYIVPINPGVDVMNSSLGVSYHF
jgi:hypothetical protein